MDRVFHLTNEFRREGPEQLTALLATSRYTVAWGPVFQLIYTAHATGRSLLSPKGFIQLLEKSDGPLKVMARAEWLLERGFRQKYPWAPAQVWRDEFDGVIRRFALEDVSKPPTDRRVIISDSERGWDRAQERLGQPDRTRLLRGLGGLYSKSQLPPGILQRATINKSRRNRHPAETILRDIFNHEDAIKLSGSSISALDPTYAHFVQDLSRMGVHLQVPIKKERIPEKQGIDLGGVADIFRRIAPITDEKRFLRFLASEDRMKFRQLVYLRNNIPLQAELHRRLIAATQREPMLGVLFPGLSSKEPIPVALTMWELTLLCISLTSQFFWGLFPFGVRVAKVGLQRVGAIPLTLRTEDKDLTSLFYLCFGTHRPTLRQTKQLVGCFCDIMKDLSCE